MRIALVGPFSGPSLAASFAPSETGVSLPFGYPGAPLMTVLARALVDRGHQVAAISTDFSSSVNELEPFVVRRIGGLHVYYCPQRPRSFRSNSGRRGRALDFFRYERDCLRRAIADYAPDIVHAHWTYEFVWAALDSGVPTLATAHDSPLKVLRFMPSLYRLFRYFMARRVLARCQHLTAVSPDLERDIRGLTHAPITVVANPIEDSILAGMGCAPQAFDSKTLVMVINGWINLKNGETALRAFGLARRMDPGLRLMCFGSGYERDGPAQRWAATEGLEAGVEFRGAVSQVLILEQLRSSLAMLHPSLLEACSMAIAEAMSVGLPVIAGCRTDGAAWQLDGGRAGVLVDVRDARAIADAIIRLSGERSRWNEISVAAQSRARRLFAVDQVVGQYLALYDEARRPLDSARVAQALP